jgi:hypothetical protein
MSITDELLIIRNQISHNYVSCIWKMLIRIRARVLVILLEVFHNLPLLFHACT